MACTHMRLHMRVQDQIAVHNAREENWLHLQSEWEALEREWELETHKCVGRDGRLHGVRCSQRRGMPAAACVALACGWHGC